MDFSYVKDFPEGKYANVLVGIVFTNFIKGFDGVLYFAYIFVGFTN